MSDLLSLYALLSSLPCPPFARFLSLNPVHPRPATATSPLLSSSHCTPIPLRCSHCSVLCFGPSPAAMFMLDLSNMPAPSPPFCSACRFAMQRCLAPVLRYCSSPPCALLPTASLLSALLRDSPICAFSQSLLSTTTHSSLLYFLRPLGCRL